MRYLPVLLLLAACSGEATPAPDTNLADDGTPVAPAATPTPRASPDATGPGTALGLTYLELEDADVLDPRGTEVAEVHEIDARPDGTVTGLRVKLKGPPIPGRMVRIGLEGLSVVPDGDEWDLRTPSTGDQLAALPTATQ